MEYKALQAPIFYISADPERGTGVEGILSNYHIICPFRSAFVLQLQAEKRRVFILEDVMPIPRILEALRRGTCGIMDVQEVQEYMQREAGDIVPNVVVLKNTEMIEEAARRYGWNLLGPHAALASEFEEKLSQFWVLKDVVRYPPSSVQVLKEVQISGLPDFPFILQFNRGHTGRSTVKVGSIGEFEDIRSQFPYREVKISDFIKGKTFTINGLVCKDKRVFSGSISLQITGFAEATNNPNATVGNDFGVVRELLSLEEAAAIQEALKRVGETLGSRGYHGFFGIDVIVEDESGVVFFIEVNTHQPASVSFEARLHRAIGAVPLFLLFFLEELGESFELKQEEWPPLLYPKAARQVIYRNKEDWSVFRDSVRTPHSQGERLLLSRLYEIKPGEEMYRVQEW